MVILLEAEDATLKLLGQRPAEGCAVSGSEIRLDREGEKVAFPELFLCELEGLFIGAGGFAESTEFEQDGTEVVEEGELQAGVRGPFDGVADASEEVVGLDELIAGLGVESVTKDLLRVVGE
jgi:hypothetical protein